MERLFEGFLDLIHIDFRIVTGDHAEIVYPGALIFGIANFMRNFVDYPKAHVFEHR